MAPALLSFLVGQPSHVNDNKHVDKTVSVSTNNKSTRTNTVVKNDTAKWTKQESKIIYTISSLTEVKKLRKDIDKQKNSARHLAIWIAKRPNATKKYFWVQVGEDNEYRLTPYLNFYVYPKSMRIMYLDTVNDDKELSLTQWRRRNGL